MSPDSRFLRNVLLLLAGVLVLRLAAGAFLPVLDPSEGRYASMIAHMVRTGNWLVPQFWHEGVFQNFDGKTPLFFWCGALAAKLFGAGNFAVRFPSFLAACGMLGMLYLTLRRFRSVTAAAFGLLFCGTGFVFLSFSGVVLTDVLLAFTISGAVLSFAGFLEENASAFRRKLWGWGCFAFLGAGFITKGPVAVVLFGIGPFLYLLIGNNWKKLKDFPWFTGFAFFFLIAVPWFVVRWFDDPDAVVYFFYNENFLRFVSKNYGDRYGAGRELHYGASLWLLLAVTCPWCLLWAGLLFTKAGRAALLTRESFRTPLEGIALYSVLGITSFWALTSRVLLYYMLPVIPCFAVYFGIRAAGLFDSPKARKVLFAGSAAAGFLTVAGLFIVNWGAAARGDATTFYVLKKAEKIRSGRGIPDSVPYAVLRECPYSLDFYCTSHPVLHHPKESATETYRRDGSAVILTKKRYLKALKGHGYADWEELGASGNWRIIMRKAAEAVHMSEPAAEKTLVPSSSIPQTPKE